jgi:hypothetical protein
MAVGWEEIVPRIVTEAGLARHTLAAAAANEKLEKTPA